jgi:hypothetical protein
VTHVRVAKRYVVFYTERDEHVCVPLAEVAQMRVGRRTKPRERQTGFTVEVDDDVERAS